MPIDTRYMDGPEPELTDEELAALRAKLAEIDARPALAVPKPSRVALPHRLQPRKVVTVQFELEGWGGVFEVPSANSLTQREQQGVASGDESTLVELFGPVSDVVMSMTNDEVQAFAKAWRDASGVTAGESPAA